MMKKMLLGCFILAFVNGRGQKGKTVFTEDITNFWKAYDLILKTGDSLKQNRIIQQEYIAKGSKGLQGIMQARRYTAAEYVTVIKKYPMFWNSIRNNTLKAGDYAGKIEAGIEKLREIYPALKPSAIYFTIGAFRTGGTTLSDRVLIGSEIAMADSSVVVSEFGKNASHLPPYFATNPIKSLVFLNVHEYIHTQQSTTIGNSLLSQTMIEGAAEFIATVALHTDSPNEQIAFGRLHDEEIRKAYAKEMFSSNFDNWIWNSADNAFNMRDLGYYVGYAICEKFYRLSVDKKQAIKTLIELDYTHEDTLSKFVEATHYFQEPLSVYKEAFESSRPEVVRIGPFENGMQQVSPDVKTVTLFFSRPMRKNAADFDKGSLGDKHVMWLQKRIGFSDDGMSYSFEIKPLEPGKRYQLLVTEAFLSSSGIPLKPYLIDITTSK